MEHEVIFVATITLIILVTMVIILFIVFQTKKNNYIINQLEAQQKMEQEIAKSHMEIQEQSLKNIGWELHDNVGQLLSIAKMQLSQMQQTLPIEFNAGATQINNLIGDSLQEIRLLSRTLNTDIILNVGLIRSIECELERFNKLNFLKAELFLSGAQVDIDRKDEIIIFRILQEFFSNVIKHSKATTLTVFIDFQPDLLLITAKDNGIGFDPNKTISNGSGLINMKSRAQLIGAHFSINAPPEGGTQLSLSYTYRNNMKYGK